jgi:hypothetical protein
MVAWRIQVASSQILADREGGIFVTGVVRDDLASTGWRSRLQPIALKLPDERYSEMEICCLVA